MSGRHSGGGPVSAGSLFAYVCGAAALYAVHIYLVSSSLAATPQPEGVLRTPAPTEKQSVEEIVKASLEEAESTDGERRVESAQCFYVQAHVCEQTGFALSVNRGLHVGSAEHIQVKVVRPGLWGKGTISLLLCDDADIAAQQKTQPKLRAERGPRRFITYEGCEVAVAVESEDLAFRQSASFKRHTDRYYAGFSTLEAAAFLGHYIVKQGGVLVLAAEDSYNDFRQDASWLFASDTVDPTGHDSVHLLKQPVPAGTEVPNVILDLTTCAREHHGCCDITESDFVTPQTTEYGPADPATSEVAAIILSSKNTIPKRRSLLDRWLLNPIQRGQTAPWQRAVISLDCFTHAIDTRLIMTDWVIGPLGEGPKGVPMITVRVPIVTHWTFEKYPNSPWYLTIDDDTLVFSENVMWALSYLDLPYSKLWYVGHSTEWKIKVFFHGKMAFGGGGILISNHGRDLWMDYWQGGVLNASRTWLMTGVCSHDGGDGTVCRCLQVASGVRNMFTDFRGFHQFDIVGTKNMLGILRDTCPSCPSVYEQTGLWLDDVVSQHTLCTFHHLLGIENGAVYPAKDGSTTGLLFYDAYGAYPHHLLMKRACGRSQNATYTMCINFGHQIQIFRPHLEPDDAFVLMDAKDGTRKKRPTENLVYLAFRPHVQEAQLCSMHYQMGGKPEVTIYIGNMVTPRAKHDPPCNGQARVVVKDMFMTADVQMGGENIFWEQKLETHTHIVEDF